MEIKEKEITKEIETKLLVSFMTRIIGSKNEVKQLEDNSFISYNPNTDCGAETALVKNNKYFILLGDFRKDLEGCKTSIECIKIYKKLIKNGAKVSMWSEYDYN